MKKEFVRLYNFSDADFKQVVDNIIKSARRDITAFETRGIDTITLDDLQIENDNFSDLETDEELTGSIAEATENKDTLRSNLEGTLTTIRSMAKAQWGIMDARYRSYSFGQISVKPDNILWRTAKRALRIATQQLSSLAAQGLTPTMLNNLQTLITNFDNAIDAKEDAENDREVATQTRIIAGNEIYKKLMRISNVGKDIWYSTNEAKYNDYLIQQYVRKRSEPIDTYKGTIASGTTLAVVTLPENVNKIVVRKTTTDLLVGLSIDGLAFNGEVFKILASKVKTISLKNFQSKGCSLMSFEI
jgi:hypothetical protein